MNVEIPDWLIEMSKQMSSDEKRGTAFPFWQVRNKVYLITEEGYSEHHFEIVNTEEGIVLYRSDTDISFSDLAIDLYESEPDWCNGWLTEKDIEIFEGKNFEDVFNESFDPELDCDDLPDGYKKFYMQEVEEVLTTHLTKADAEWFIERKRHDYPNAYTYVASAYWSPQFRSLQDWIRALTGGKSGA